VPVTVTVLNPYELLTLSTPEFATNDVLPISALVNAVHFAPLMVIGDENTEPSMIVIAPWVES
jgi:hypothetical protein